MVVTCCCHISIHSSERQILVVFQLCVHFGWSSQLMKLLLAMMKPSWLGAVFWCKGYLLRCQCYFVSSCLYYVQFSSQFIVLSCGSNCQNVGDTFYQRAKHVSVYLPSGQSWYYLSSGTAFKGGSTHKMEVLEDSVPAFQRAGTIIPRKDRFRRSSTQMANDPYTLVCVFHMQQFYLIL